MPLTGTHKADSALGPAASSGGFLRIGLRSGEILSTHRTDSALGSAGSSGGFLRIGLRSGEILSTHTTDSALGSAASSGGFPRIGLRSGEILRTRRTDSALGSAASSGGFHRIRLGCAGEILKIAVVLLCPLGLLAQAPMGSALRINATDLAVLEAHEVRKDLACTVTPNKPELGFDLRFHGGFDVNVPLSELSGSENQLTILFRVIPDNHKDKPSYFVQHIHVPEIADDAKGDATLRGMVDLGEGSYQVDWLMRDRSERVCSFYWDSEAVLPPKDKQIELALAPGEVERMVLEQFSEEPPVERAQVSPPLNIKVLVNFAPQFSDASTMRPIDTMALVTMLRRIAREPQFGKFSLVAFNIQEQRVVYRQSSADKIDFPALGEAVHNIKLGTVDVKHLAQKHGEIDFLTDLIKKEVAAGDHPDAVIFAGPKIMLDDAMPEDQIRSVVTDVDFPVFYVNYNLYPQDMPWKDTVSHAVKLFRGTEYTISRPRDLWFDVTEMVSRIVKSKHGRNTNPVSSQ